MHMANDSQQNDSQQNKELLEELRNAAEVLGENRPPSYVEDAVKLNPPTSGEQ